MRGWGACVWCVWKGSVWNLTWISFEFPSLLFLACHMSSSYSSSSAARLDPLADFKAKAAALPSTIDLPFRKPSSAASSRPSSADSKRKPSSSTAAAAAANTSKRPSRPASDRDLIHSNNNGSDRHAKGSHPSRAPPAQKPPSFAELMKLASRTNEDDLRLVRPASSSASTSTSTSTASASASRSGPPLHRQDSQKTQSSLNSRDRASAPAHASASAHRSDRSERIDRPDRPSYAKPSVSSLAAPSRPAAPASSSLAALKSRNPTHPKAAAAASADLIQVNRTKRDQPSIEDLQEEMRRKRREASGAPASSSANQPSRDRPNSSTAASSTAAAARPSQRPLSGRDAPPARSSDPRDARLPATKRSRSSSPPHLHASSSRLSADASRRPGASSEQRPRPDARNDRGRDPRDVRDSRDPRDRRDARDTDRSAPRSRLDDRDRPMARSRSISPTPRRTGSSSLSGSSAAGGSRPAAPAPRERQRRYKNMDEVLQDQEFVEKNYSDVIRKMMGYNPRRCVGRLWIIWPCPWFDDGGGPRVWHAHFYSLMLTRGRDGDGNGG
ncbi:hypothetical protein BC831DRAFT_287995 [Entophlyctis helioformis]|nr:hypothetical protein BC831DRAFT_287995 [Entophlyctis helioformis]